MSDELLDFYNRELSYFRKLAGGFAEKNPGIAGRLRLGERVEDPHVSRLIEAFAYLNARVRMKIEDEFPELCQAILSVLYPDYLTPFPSCSIVRFHLQRSQMELLDGFDIPAGTELDSQSIDGTPCRFRTCYPATAWPFDLIDGEIQTPPFVVPQTDLSQTAKGVVKLKLKMFADRVKFNQLSLDKLRFFLHGDSRYIYDLYELILNNATGVLVASSDKAPFSVQLPPDVLTQVGFQLDESLLPKTARSRHGYHLLTELFVFPEKFLFFDINRLDEAIRSQASADSELSIYIFFDRMPRNLEKNIATSSFHLGATPAVNLFEQRAEPILIRSASSELRVTPDVRRPLFNEVYTVNRVTATSPDQKTVEMQPFYSTKHRSSNEEGCYWFADRRDSVIREDALNAAENLGTDVFLNLVGLDAKKRARDFQGWTIDVETTCFNRDYPNRLPANSSLTPVANAELVQTTTVVHPSETVRPNHRDEAYWRLISHLSLNHISLEEQENGAEALQEILRLYNLSQQRAAEMMIDGVEQIGTRRIVTRIGGELSSGFCKGTEITVTLNEDNFTGGGHFLFGSVLDRFFAQYTSINSFTKTVVKTRQQESSLAVWPARVGETRLV